MAVIISMSGWLGLGSRPYGPARGSQRLGETGMEQNKHHISSKIIPIFTFALGLCICSCRETRESARKTATRKFERVVVNELRVDSNLFLGPFLVTEDSENFVFHWTSVVPDSGATIIEVRVSKIPGGRVGLFERGPRADLEHLIDTKGRTYSEALLF